ncbi:MAG: hypothetical protein KAH95_00025 [Spirochaetales bacterium]|nr:hypothetical protein [Spirochaetales bacterium]
MNFSKVPEETKIVQELSLFVLVEDEDGVSDIANVYIIHDESELFWELDPDNWAIKVISGKNWLGSNSISMNDNSNMPSGLYRIVVIDKAGERDSSKINIPSSMLKSDKNIKFPNLIIDSDIIIESDFLDNTLRIYDESMVLLKNLKIESGKINKSIIVNDTNSKAHWVSIYSFNEETGTGYIRGPYLFNPVR